MAEFYEGNFSGLRNNLKLKVQVYDLKQGPSPGTLKAMTPDLGTEKRGP